jgi:hypothetical protein
MPPAAVAGQTELALQAGAVVDARVVQVTAEGMARIAIANTLIDVMAAAPLTAGDTLRLAVAQTGEGVKLTIVSQNPLGAASDPGAAAQATASRMAAPGNSRADAPLPATGEAPASAPHTTAVAQLVRDNVARQASLAPLFADLAKAALRGDLPPQVRASAAQLLAMRPTLSENLSAQALRAAVQRAGPFPQAAVPAAGSQSPVMPELKAALVVFRQVLAAWLTAETGGRAGQPLPLPAASQPASQLAALPQMPAGSIVPSATESPAGPALPTSPASPAILAGPQGTASAPTPSQPGPAATAPSGTGETAAAATVATEKAVPGAPQPATAPQLSAQSQLRQLTGGALLTLLQEVQQGGRELARMTAEGKAGALDPLARLIRADAGAEKQAVWPATPAMPVEATRANLPPPLPGGLPTPQPVAATALVNDMSLVDVGRKLLDDADGAIARQTLLQVASLPQGADAPSRAEAAAPRWNFEIPFATPQGTAVAQFEISRDGGRTAREDVRPVWQARFTISIEPVGPVHAQVLLSGDRTSVRLWAERPESAAALREGAQQLSRALKEADLVPGDILVGEGAPTPAQAGAAVRAGRYLDRAT